MLPGAKDLVYSAVDTLQILGRDRHILTLNIRELRSGDPSESANRVSCDPRRRSFRSEGYS